MSVSSGKWLMDLERSALPADRNQKFSAKMHKTSLKNLHVVSNRCLPIRCEALRDTGDRADY